MHLTPRIIGCRERSSYRDHLSFSHSTSLLHDTRGVIPVSPGVELLSSPPQVSSFAFLLSLSRYIFPVAIRLYVRTGACFYDASETCGDTTIAIITASAVGTRRIHARQQQQPITTSLGWHRAQRQTSLILVGQMRHFIRDVDYISLSGSSVVECTNSNRVSAQVLTCCSRLLPVVLLITFHILYAVSRGSSRERARRGEEISTPYPVRYRLL